MNEQTDYRSNPIFIVGAPNSGTNLLNALFDWHPQLVVVPVEIEYYKKLSDYLDPVSSRPKEDFNQIIFSPSSQVAWMDPGVSTINQNQSRRDFSNLDFNVFRRQVLDYDLKIFDRKAYFENIFEAYRQAAALPLVDLRGFLTRSIGDLHYIPDILEDFPQAKIIHVLRDPRDNYVSYSKSSPEKIQQWPQYGGVFVAAVTEKILPSFRIGQSMKENEHRDYRFVKYEDLVQNTEPVMRRLAEFLGIDWDEILLRPTMCGKAWGGNSSKPVQFVSVSPSSLQRFKKELSPLQIETIERLGFQEMEAFDYAVESASGPFRGFAAVQAILALKRLRRRARRKLRLLSEKIFVHDLKEDIFLKDIIWPYRVDLLIRIDFLKWYEENKGRFGIENSAALSKADVLANTAFFEEARSHPYFFQFTRKHRYRRLNLNREKSEEVYAEGIAIFVNLWNAVQQRGFDKEQKIGLIRGIWLKRPVYGEKIRRKYYMGDGCHRFACLAWSRRQASLSKEYFHWKFRFFFRPINSFGIFKKLRIFNDRDEATFDRVFHSESGPEWREVMDWMENVRLRFKQLDQEELFDIKFTD